MNNIVNIKNLSKDFYTLDGEVNAINDISLDIIENEFLSIVGSSGCGKSTLLNIIAGLDFPTNGTINYNISKPVIGYMFQNDAMLPWLTILENCTLGLEIMKNKNEETIEYTKNLLNKYGLKEFTDKYPSALSGGMKQRVP